MIVSIINTNNATTLKFTFKDDEKSNVSSDDELDFMHTPNITIKDSASFKQQLLDVLNNIEIKKTNTI